MVKIQVIGTKRCQLKTIQSLHHLGTVQIDEWSEARSLSQQRIALNNEAIQLRERLAYMATRVEAVLAALPVLGLLPSPEYEHHYPHLEAQRDYIQTLLDEREWEGLFRLKRVKVKLAR
jgi:type IV secretory pathway component VirB8